MDRSEKHQQRKEKERVEKNRQEKAYEEAEQQRRLPINSVWFMLAGIVLTLMAVYVWITWLR